MFKYLFAILLTTFIVPLPAYCQNFEVLEVDEYNEQAVLVDTDTGEEWVAEIGDEIAGWQVVRITAQYVTMSKPQEDQPMLMTNISVRPKGGKINMLPYPQSQ
jgi:hypothetical protein